MNNGQQSTDSCPTSADSCPTVSRQLPNSRPTVAQQLADSCPTVGRQFPNSRPTVGRQYILGTVLHYYPCETLQELFHEPNIFSHVIELTLYRTGRIWSFGHIDTGTKLTHTYLFFSSVLIVRSTDSCCIRDSNTGCDKGQGVWEKASSGLTFSQTYITTLRSAAVRA